MRRSGPYVPGKNRSYTEIGRTFDQSRQRNWTLAKCVLFNTWTSSIGLLFALFVRGMGGPAGSNLFARATSQSVLIATVT